MMIEKGQTVPAVDIFEATPEGPKPANTGELLKGKKTVLFAVPGAFTPTCSAKHLPGFVENLDALKAKGIDQVACMSVNDAFVMDAWGKSANAQGITMLADGNGSFTEALGLEMDGTGFGMGKRSQRFALIVENGQATEVLVEEPGAFEVSSAEYVLSKL
ncbi:MAG: peroxiredoxin [Pseudomonadota bacterium]